MKHIRATLILLLLSAVSTLTALASIQDLPVTSRNGKAYYYYEVQPKETIYSLTHKLGITREEIIRHNPSVADGLKAHTTLYFPAPQADMPRSHKVEKGETIYGISKRYGMSPDRLIELNPFLSDGLKTGQTLRLEDSAGAPVQAAADVDMRGHLVEDGETFYSIARRYNVSVAQLEAANPSVPVLKKGQVLNIPVIAQQTAPVTVTEPAPAAVAVTAVAVDTVAAAPAPAVVAITENTPVNIVTPALEEAEEVTVDKGEIKIAVALPFMLVQGSKMSKPAARMTEFYKGFLIAVDSLRRIGSPIKVYAYDTADNTDSVKSILRRPEMKDVQVIIAPDNEEHLAMIADFASRNGSTVLNPFAVKDESYLTNSAMIQANIPTAMMYTKAIKGITSQFPGYTPVIVSRTDGPDDKREFTDELKKQLSDAGITYTLLTFTNKLTTNNLKGLDSNTGYLFIPVSGRQAEANRILPALNEYRETLDNPDNIRVFGYPEWTTFRGETLTNMQNLNTVIYSRFYTPEELDSDATDIENRYKAWYGGKGIEKAVPRQGLFGFDTGMFLIRALQRNQGDFGKAAPTNYGVQNSFHLVSPGGAKGYVNDVLYFINYRPSGLINKEIL